MARITDEKDEQITITPDAASGGDSKGSTLLPMLIAGLALVVIGAIVLMYFV
ncbi:hypothetical protein [Falsochrobactrum shanghaiense]|uniref:hypothetical protein n=1 Tax=Falsochrobactrum shanghaiense TaxID=2201899 RepID=UPI0018EE63A5|nr:hypothetical protein [Falsochrobactrum shanghaiense]